MGSTHGPADKHTPVRGAKHDEVPMGLRSGSSLKAQEHLMSDANDERGSHRPHPQPMAAPYLEFDLASEAEQLQLQPGSKTGQNAKTLVKNDQLRVVLMVLKAHARIPSHQTEG